jgi:hypothetical protein
MRFSQQCWRCSSEIWHPVTERVVTNVRNVLWSIDMSGTTHIMAQCHISATLLPDLQISYISYWLILRASFEQHKYSRLSVLGSAGVIQITNLKICVQTNVLKAQLFRSQKWKYQDSNYMKYIFCFVLDTGNRSRSIKWKWWDIIKSYVTLYYFCDLILTNMGGKGHSFVLPAATALIFLTQPPSYIMW